MSRGQVPILYSILALIFVVLILVAFYFLTVFSTFLSKPTQQTIHAVDSSEADLLLLNLLRTPITGGLVYELSLVEEGDTYYDFLVKYGEAGKSYETDWQADLLFGEFYGSYTGAEYELSIESSSKHCDADFELKEGMFLCVT